MTLSRIQLSETGVWQLMHWDDANEPCASTSRSSGSPAILSSVSMFCVKQRRSFFFSSRRVKNECVNVGLKLPGKSSFEKVKNGCGLSWKKSMSSEGQSEGGQQHVRTLPGARTHQR